jgi:hypothetical protein
VLGVRLIILHCKKLICYENLNRASDLAFELTALIFYVFCSREEFIAGSRKKFPDSAPHGRQPRVSGLSSEGLAESHLVSAAAAAKTE